MTNEVEHFLASCLLKAVQAENFEYAKALMEKYNANPYYLVNGCGIAPLHFSVCMTDEAASERFTKYFLKHNGDPNVQTEDGETPLHIACYYGRTKIVQLLMANGGDISLKDSDGNTALNITINEGHFDVFELIKKIKFQQKEEKFYASHGKNNQIPTIRLNKISYDMNAASPYYVNITRRRKPSAIVQQGEVETAIGEKINIFELNKSNLEEFQKKNDGISRNSLVKNWKEQIMNTELEVNFDDFLNKFNTIGSSSTKLPYELDVDVANESFYTANSNVSETGFIKSPNATNEDQMQVVVDYRHIDRVNGLIFYERKIEPCMSQTDKSDSKTTVSTKYTVPSDYNTADLRHELTQFGDSPGPITKSTKYLYMKRLMKFRRHPELVKLRSESHKISYSFELEKTLKEHSWKETLETYAEADLEGKMVNYFESSEFMQQNNREDCLKKCFVYMLIDPRISENLPGVAKTLDPLEAWKRFIQSIFYVGKGTSSRPYSHLYDAIKMYQHTLQPRAIAFQNSPKVIASPSSKKINESEKLKRINDIWKMNRGVVCLNIFHNIMGHEAYTREAAIIEAIGLDNLTNLKRGEYRGVTKTWDMRSKKQFGTTLLYKSFKIFLSEGESQLRPNDIKS